MYSQPQGANKETVWEEYRRVNGGDSTLTVMFKYKGLQLARERIEFKYANKTIESNEMLITNFRDALELYKSQVFLLNGTIVEREEEIERLKQTNASLNGDLDLVQKQLRKERGKKWIIGGTVVVGAAGLLLLMSQ